MEQLQYVAGLWMDDLMSKQSEQYQGARECIALVHDNYAWALQAHASLSVRVRAISMCHMANSLARSIPKQLHSMLAGALLGCRWPLPISCR